jgi:DNA-binding transcriptional ArsR family regulator
MTTLNLYLSSNDDIMILRRDIFQAIADPTRRSILILLAAQPITAGDIADNFDAARSTVSKHIRILTECGLVEANQKGREIYYQIKIERMAEIDLWLDEIRNVWEKQFDKLGQYLEKIQKK